MKQNRKKWMQGLSCFLAFAIVAAAFTWTLPEHTVEPENPIRTEAEELKVDVRMQDGASDAQSENELQGENEQEEQEESDTRQEEIAEEEPEQPPQQPPEKETVVEENKEISEELPPELGESEKTNGEGQGDTGENSENVPGTDESGKLPAEGGDETIDEPGTGEAPGEDEHGLITDLYSRIITFSELENDMISFYAYYSDASVDAQIKVNYKHESESGNGTWLEVRGEHDYETKLKLGKNYITIYYTDGKGDRNWARMVLTYQAEKADAQEPVVGEHPPVIETNLDDWRDDINTKEFTFVVSAKTWQGKRIYSDCIQVRMDGNMVTNPTGSGIYEYVLRFERPNIGDFETHTVSVLAWDAEGNSRYVEYQIRYYFHNEGEKLGNVQVVIDATTVECGIVDEGSVELKAGETAAQVVIRMLEEYGYSYRHTGSLENEFYLSSISRANAFKGCHIGERLQRLLERDGITFTSPGSRDKLGEFDFTRGSGWLYFINGDLCPGKAMSAWTLNGGETITLRFTLAYGKDVGESYDSEGALSSYCAKWVNGQVIELGHDFQESAREEAGSDTDGYIEYTCTRCEETRREILPATGEESETPDPPEGGEEPETPDPPESGEEPETPNPPEGGEEPETPDPPEGGEEPETPDPPEGGEEPGNPEPPGGGEEPENPNPPESGETE